MTRELQNAIKRFVAAMLDQRAANTWGVVTSVDPSRPAVRVRLMPDGVLTGWLPITQMAAAGGWGAFTMPTPGMSAFCQPDSGRAGHWVVTGFQHNESAMPPKVPNFPGAAGVRSVVPAATVGGEFMAVHKSGSVIRLCDDGSIFLSADLINIDGNLRVNGSIHSTTNITATLDISDQEGAHGTMDYLRSQYNAHAHDQDPDSYGDTEVKTHLTDHPA